MQQQSSHIHIYGELTDYLTGKTLADSDDERIRQSLARLLVEERGFVHSDLLINQQITTTFLNVSVVSHLDIVAQLKGCPLIVLRCAPGSLVSRERSAIAAARIWHPEYQLPLAVVYNGRDGELIDCYTGKVIATGVSAIPHKKELGKWFSLPLHPPQQGKALEREQRILNAFDRQHCCLPEKK